MLLEFENEIEDYSKNVSKIPTEKYLNIGNIKIIDQSAEEISGFIDKAEKVCKQDAIIFGDHTRIIKYAEAPFVAGADGVKILVPKNRNEYILKYLFYNLKSFKLINLGYSRHYKLLKETKITKVSLEKQQEIVAILDAINSIIDADKKQLELMNESIKSRFIEMFGNKDYPYIRFEDYMERCVDIGSNGANAVVMEHYNITDNKDYAMVIRFTNLNSNDFTEDVKYLNESDYNFFKKSKVYGGEIIFCKIGSAGLNYIMPKLDIPVTLGLNQIMITPKNINTIYLYNYINSNEGLDYISKHTQGAVTKTITKHALWDFPIMTPPIELQNEFESFVKQIDKSKFNIQQHLNLMQELLDKKMKEFFGGFE